LKRYCNLINLDSGKDYRAAALKGKTAQYFDKSEVDADKELNKLFKVLGSQENDIVRPKTFTHFGRHLTFAKTCGQVLDSTFTELCDSPLGASDYLQIAHYFHTVIIRDIPQLNLKLRSQTRRFITLIDTLYDNRIRLVISADVPFNRLFSSERPEDFQDEQRVLMDDLNITKNDAGAGANVFTGEEEIFAFDRTLSRLSEMQTEAYWNLWAKHR
jgi:protein AFG1